jgi:hypothetical protein
VGGKNNLVYAYNQGRIDVITTKKAASGTYKHPSLMQILEAGKYPKEISDIINENKAARVLALKKGDIETVETLLAKDIKKIMKLKKSGMTSLTCAYIAGYLDV